MNNPEKPKSQEWLKNDEERNRRLGQLGLSKNQNYSDLSQEEKQFLDMDYKSRQFIEDSLSSFIHNHDDISYEEGKSYRRDYINSFMKWYNRLSGAFISPDGKNSNQLTMAFVDSLFSLNVSPEKLKKINLLMLEPDTPNFAKQMATFKVLYPDIKTSFADISERKQTAYNNSNNYVSSPVLNNIDQFGGIKDENNHLYTAGEIIYRDILKCAFGSGGENIRHFLDKLSSGSYMMRAIMCWPNNDERIEKYYSREDLDGLQTLIRQLHSIYYQTTSGEKEGYNKNLISISSSRDEFGEKTISDIKTDIRIIYDEYQPTERYGLADRVVRSFCYPLGIKSLSEAYDMLNTSRMESYARHKSLIVNGEIGLIHKGDFVKSLSSSDHLPYLLENGILAKEFLGVGASSDCTPLDTDVAMVVDNTDGLRHAIRQSCAAAFSGMGNDDGSRYYAGRNAENIFLVFRNNHRFFVNESGYNWNDEDYDNYEQDYSDGFYYDAGYYYDYDNDDDIRKYKIPHRYYGKTLYNKNRYEVFPPVEHFVVKKEDEFYDDDYGIRTGIPSSEIDYIATDEKSAEKVVEAVKESGLYIPVTDLDGNLIFNPFKS